MDHIHQDGYVLYVRAEACRAGFPETAEQPVMECPSYEEARSWQRLVRNHSRDCVIRFVGEGGGGD